MKRLAITLLLIFIHSTSLASQPQNKLHWADWTDNLFTKAQAENRYVILDLEAVWCHWCHMMDKNTYSDPAVQALLNKHYINVRVDQDARPDLANRYRDYGWPATIIFAPDGTEIVKRAGYIAPENMTRLLQAVVDDPSPEKAAALNLPSSFARQGALSKELIVQLQQNHSSAIDPIKGGLRTNHKYIDRDSLEYAIHLASKGNQVQQKWAQKTLDQALKLFDPVWGGVYQYSTQGDWDHQHYEKIMLIQASYLRLYALAWATWKNPRYFKATQQIINYLDRFLTSPESVFYTSQDADVIPGQHSDEFFKLNDQQRIVIGIPRIDKHIYARENGWMIEALAYLYEVSGNKAYLERAEKAAHWIIKHRSLKNGGYSHDEHDKAGPYLGDNLAMSRAFLQLYRAEGKRQWLDYAVTTTQYINQHFQYEQGGFTPVVNRNQVIKPVPQIDENISLVRFSNLLFHYTGDDAFKQMAEHGMRYLATPEIAESRLTEAGILLANDELKTDPMHITVIGGKDNAKANALYHTAREVAQLYKRIEWWDEREGKLPNPDVQYPSLGKTSAFVCNDGRCSLPLFSSKEILRMLN